MIIIDHIQKYYKTNWRHENALGGSELAVLFPNELTQNEVGFKSEVEFPIMTSPKLQEGWSQAKGFDEDDATEKNAVVELTEAFTSYTKIAKINVAAESWAASKIQILEAIEASTYDEFVLNKICTGVENKFDKPTTITKDNIVIELKKLEKQAKALKFRLKDALILISPSVASMIVNNNLASSVQTIENTNITVRKIFNKYTTLETDIDEYGFQIVALLPTAFAFASGVETPLQSGVYTQGRFLGQIFTAVNKFYGAKVIMPDKIIGYEDPNSTPEEASASKTYVNPQLDDFKTKNLEEMEELYQGKTNFTKNYEKLFDNVSKANSSEAVIKLVDLFKEQMKNA